MRNPLKVSVDAFRSNLAEYVNSVRYRRSHVVIKKHNKDAAVLLSPEEYEWLTDPTKRFSKQEWEDKFSLFDDIQQHNSDKSAKEVEKDVTEAVHEVRRRKIKR